MRIHKTLVLALLAGALGFAQQMPLPETSISLTSKAGQQLLLESQHRADFWPLSIHYETQSNNSFCGPASGVMVLRALGAPPPPSATNPPFHEHQQENFFNPGTDKVLTRNALVQQGATLDELAGMLQAHDLKTTVRHASEGQVDLFRKEASEALADETRYVIINFDRDPLQQKGGTHFSPLAAYHAPSDRFLVMDVARFRYPPFWVKTDLLYQGMNTVDSVSAKTRGYVLVERRR
jgi:hypothetical protein